MKIHQLHLQDFRNYTDRVFDFEGDKVFIFGPNGIGKTNILEAISLLSIGKSWRESSSRDLILGSSPSAKISAKAGEHDWTLLVQERSRIFEREGKRLSAKEALGQVSTLLFCPEMLQLFTGGKKDRLAYLDRFACQLDLGFRQALFRAVKAHKQKTALLRELQEDPSRKALEELRPWNQILAETMPLIWAFRASVLMYLATHLQKSYHEMSGKTEPVGLELIPSHMDKDQITNIKDQDLMVWLESQVDQEVMSRRNSLSPLRDDVAFLLREKGVKESASRGEERTMLLALLSAQKELLKAQYDVIPILLLDDVFSELDEARQTHLEKLCEGVQTFFTTTHEEHIEGFGSEVQKIAL